MRKIVKKVLAFSLAAAMVVQPLPTGIANNAITTALAAPVTNTSTVPAAQSRADAAKNNQTWQVGAKMPYFRYDTSPGAVPNSYSNNATNLAAMDANTVSYQDNYSGTKKQSTDWDKMNIASQASNQSYVELGSGKSITFRMTAGHGGDGVTVRYTLPDGGGSDSAGKPIGKVSNFSVSTSNNATVLGYQNEDTSQRYNTYMTGNKVKVTSDYAWQYFSSGHPTDGQGNGTPCFAFDEVHFRLDKALNANDTITITNSGSETLGIDFIEVEQTTYVSKPSGAISVPAGSHTQKQIEGYITQAEAGNGILYFEPGVHLMPFKWILAGGNLKITGAGMWYTKMQFTGSGMSGGGIVGEKEGWCRGIDFSNMYINSNLHSRFDQQANYKCFADLFAQGCSIHDVWEEHFECGFWIGRYSNTAQYDMSDLKIYNCRIRNNFADGINFCQGTHDSAAYNNNSRNNGDDGLAMWNATDFQPDDEYNNIFAYNTVEFIWRAGSMAIYGGHGHKMYNNYIRDAFTAAGIHLNTNFAGPKFQNNSEGIDIENNVMVRCGTYSDSWNESLGAIDVTGDVKNVRFKNNELYDSQNNGIRTLNNNGQGVSFTNTVIFGAGLDKRNDTYSCSAHSATAVRQGNAIITYNNLLVKNVVTKYVSESADKHWPYYCDVATNLPTVPTNQSQYGNLDYSFTVNSSGAYSYSGSTYPMVAEAKYYPGYDYNKGKAVNDGGPEPVTYEPITNPQPVTEETQTQPVTGQPETDAPYNPKSDDIELNGDSVGKSSMEGAYSVPEGSYAWQGWATFKGDPDKMPNSSYKYLILTYTGDISTFRFEFCDIDDSGNVLDKSDATWFDPEQEHHFVAYNNRTIPMVGNETTICIDLEASDISLQWWDDGVHMHSGDTGNAGGNTFITKAYLSKQPIDIEHTTSQPVTGQEPVTGQTQTQTQTQTQVPTQDDPFAVHTGDLVLSTVNSSSAYDNTGLQEVFSWTGDYKYQGLATFTGANDTYKYLVLKYDGPIASIRLEMDGKFMWFSENAQGNFVTKDGDFLPAEGDGETYYVVDLAQSGVVGSDFKTFHIHSGNGTASTVDIKTAYLTSRDVDGGTTPTESGTVSPSESYDLVLGGISYPTNAKYGDTVTFTALVQNASNVAVPAGAQVRFTVDGTTVATATASAIPANGSVKVTGNYNAVAGGHTVVAIIDPNNRLAAETPKTNNSRTKKFNVETAINRNYTATSGADLYVTDISYVNLTTGQTNGSIAVGDQICWQANGVNAGDTAIGSGTKIGVQYQVDGQGWPADTFTWCDSFYGPLASHAFYDFTANGGTASGTNKNIWIATAGTHSIMAWIDDSTLIGESNEGNNQTTKNITVPYAGPNYVTADDPDNLDNIQPVTQAPTEAPTVKPTEPATEPTTEKPTREPVTVDPDFDFPDIILDGGEEGASPMIGTYTAPTSRGQATDAYKYLGFASFLDMVPDVTYAQGNYKYLVMTYTGDITQLRYEFVRAGVAGDGSDDEKQGPFWFNPEGQTMAFVTKDGSDIPLVGNNTTIVIDLEASGVEMDWYNSGVHMHDDMMKTYGNGEGFTISNAYLTVNPPSDEPVTQKPTEAPTQAPTEKPTEAPTQAPTEKPTEAPTQAPTEPVTEPVTEPDDQMPDPLYLDGGEEGGSSMIGTYTAPTSRGKATDAYKYMGFASFLDMVPDWTYAEGNYKYLVMTYTGDITQLRYEFTRAGVAGDGSDDEKQGPFWFNPEGQTMYFTTYSGDEIPLIGDNTTICIDLEASGVELDWYNSGVHMHCDEMLTHGNGEGYTISDAYLTKNPVGPTPSEKYTVTVDGTVVATVDAGTTYTFPTTANVGYYGDGKLYKSGSTYTVNKDVSFSSVNLRMSKTPNLKYVKPAGFRFSGKIVCSDEALFSSNAIVESGLLIAPNDYLSNGSELSMNSGVKYSKVATSVWVNNVLGSFATSFDGIIAKNYERDFVSRGYMIVNYADGSRATLYSAVSTPTSVSELAYKTFRNKTVYNSLSEANKELILEYAGLN
jgi:hypothetical protein